RDLLYLDQIKQIMYRAWTQPGNVDISGMVTKVQISLRADGALVGSAIVKTSGNTVMDQSVLQAVHSVARIPGVPAEFLSAHPCITIAFELTN
ncbi:MAG: energy transducer TonB, partial [bacterium]